MLFVAGVDRPIDVKCARGEVLQRQKDSFYHVIYRMTFSVVLWTVIDDLRSYCTSGAPNKNSHLSQIFDKNIIFFQKAHLISTLNVHFWQDWTNFSS